jgi:hypothetical protein
MKALSIKIPINIAKSMDDRGELNPSWIAGFLIINMRKELENETVRGLCMNYTFKIDSLLHQHVKEIAKTQGLPLSQFVARLLQKYYK